MSKKEFKRKRVLVDQLRNMKENLNVLKDQISVPQTSLFELSGVLDGEISRMKTKLEKKRMHLNYIQEVQKEEEERKERKENEKMKNNGYNMNYYNPYGFYGHPPPPHAFYPHPQQRAFSMNNPYRTNIEHEKPKKKKRKKKKKNEEEEIEDLLTPFWEKKEEEVGRENEEDLIFGGRRSRKKKKREKGRKEKITPQMQHPMNPMMMMRNNPYGMRMNNPQMEMMNTMMKTNLMLQEALLGKKSFGGHNEKRKGVKEKRYEKEELMDTDEEDEIEDMDVERGEVKGVIVENRVKNDNNNKEETPILGIEKVEKAKKGKIKIDGSNLKKKFREAVNQRITELQIPKYNKVNVREIVNETLGKQKSSNDLRDFFRKMKVRNDMFDEKEDETEENENENEIMEKELFQELSDGRLEKFVFAHGKAYKSVDERAVDFWKKIINCYIFINFMKQRMIRRFEGYKFHMRQMSDLIQASSDFLEKMYLRISHIPLYSLISYSSEKKEFDLVKRKRGLTKIVPFKLKLSEKEKGARKIKIITNVNAFLDCLLNLWNKESKICINEKNQKSLIKFLATIARDYSLLSKRFFLKSETKLFAFNKIGALIEMNSFRVQFMIGNFLFIKTYIRKILIHEKRKAKYLESNMSVVRTVIYLIFIFCFYEDGKNHPFKVLEVVEEENNKRRRRRTNLEKKKEENEEKKEEKEEEKKEEEVKVEEKEEEEVKVEEKEEEEEEVEEKEDSQKVKKKKRENALNEMRLIKEMLQKKRVERYKNFFILAADERMKKNYCCSDDRIELLIKELLDWILSQSKRMKKLLEYLEERTRKFNVDQNERYENKELEDESDIIPYKIKEDVFKKGWAEKCEKIDRKIERENIMDLLKLSLSGKDINDLKKEERESKEEENDDGIIIKNNDSPQNVKFEEPEENNEKEKSIK